MNKENYTPVDMEIIKFASEDVITTSGELPEQPAS